MNDASSSMMKDNMKVDSIMNHDAIMKTDTTMKDGTKKEGTTVTHKK